MFQPQGLSDLYARFFGDSAELGLLQRRLGALGMTSSVALEVSWDETFKAGTITLNVPEADRRAEALLPAVAAGEPVPVDRLSILMAPIARYRSGLAERYDLRILSFGLKLSFWDRSTGSHCSVTGDLNDPEGARVGPCFRCLHPRSGALELCRDGDAWPARITGDPRGLRMLESALRSQPSG